MAAEPGQDIPVQGIHLVQKSLIDTKTKMLEREMLGGIMSRKTIDKSKMWNV